MTLGGSQVVAGGRFDSLNGVKSTGVGALDAVTGATRPFAINQLITNQGVNSAIWSLSTDGTDVYGTGYDYFGPGNLEGSFRARADGGAIVAINDCRGDHYSTFARGGAVYIASHAHDCGNIGSFPEQSPNRVHKYATALSHAPAGVVGPNTVRNGNLRGQPAHAVLPWWPTFEGGQFTGQFQAGWTVSGNDEYVVYGGEFPRVNGVAQQGLVRFAVPSLAPNDRGPASNQLLTGAAPFGPGMARVTWQTSSDQDNANLTYRVYRDTTTNMVHETTVASEWWNRPSTGFTDVGVTAGSHRYRVTASDPWGNTITSPWTTIDVAAGPTTRAYSGTVRADGARNYWPLGESSGAAVDNAGTADMLAGSGVTRGRPGAIASDTDTAYAFSGGSTAFLATQTAVPAPDVFSVEAWFQTTSTAGGKIVSFGNSRTANSSSHDRHVYIDADGRLTFGVYTGARATLQSTTSVEDGKWHHVVASLSTAGMALYLDGALVGSRADVTTGQRYNGFWRVGGDTAWSGAGYLNGVIDEVAVYGAPLTPAQVAGHYAQGSGTPPPNQLPTAAFSHTESGLTVSVDGSGSTDPEGGELSYAWHFGDGATGSGATTSHEYAEAGTYTVTLTVTDPAGGLDVESAPVTVTAPPPNQAIASDAFERSVASGWGAADLGGNWTMAGAGSSSSVSGGAGHLQVPNGGGSATALLNSVSVRDVAVQADVALSVAPTGGGTYVYLGTRWANNNRYRAALRFLADGDVRLYINRVVGGQETILRSLLLPGVTYTAGSVMHFKFDVSGAGTTTLQAKAWAAGTPEPTTWQNTVTDSTAALQTAGGVAAVMYLSGSTTSLPVRLDVDNFWVGQAGSGPGGPPANQAPTAAFTHSESGLTVSVDGAGSTDPESGALSYAWNFGDGATATGATASHPYATAGTYTVTLTVTDPAGATDTETASVTVAQPPPDNQAPTAAFTHSESGLTVSVDGAGSTDPESGALSYAWNFGDGATATGATASHPYATAGTYTVTLTVTDPAGATDTETASVTVAGASPPPVAADAFERAVASGWGTADTGGNWTMAGAGSSSSVSGGKGHLQVPSAGGSATALLNSVSVQDIALQADVSLSVAPTGGGTYVYLSSRWANNNRYRAALRFLADGRVTLYINRVVGGQETILRSLTLPGVTYTAGSVMHFKFDVSGAGTTTLQAKAWAAGTPEPTTWQNTVTDSTAALQAPGGLAVVMYLSGSSTNLPVRLDVDNLWAGPAGSGPPAP
jgi:PKD repeat protein